MLNGGVVQLVNDTNKRSKQALQPYQSLWLSHWKRTGSDAAGETSSPNAFRSEELDYVSHKDGLTKGLEASLRSASRTFEIGDDAIKVGSKSLGNDRMLGSLFKNDQDADGMQALSPDLAQSLEGCRVVDHRSRIQLASLVPCTVVANGIPSRGCNSVGADVSDNPPKWMGTRTAMEDSLFGLNPLQESLVESSSHILPHKSDKGKAAEGDAYMRMVEHERCYGRRQTDLLCERKVGSPSQSDNSLDECLRESVSCDHCLSMINRGWFLKMHKCSGIKLLPSESNSSEEYERKKSHNDCYSQLKLQNCVHGVGTVRIFSAVDVSEGTLAGFPRFFQTNNDLLITKKTDVNLFKENATFRSKKVTTKINRNMSEVKDCIRDVKASKVTIMNELSNEIDTMEMDSFKEKKSKKNLHSASNSTASTKAFNMKSNEGVSSRKVGHGLLNNKLPDINLELPALTGAASLPRNTCPSSSKTLSVESDELIENVKQQHKLKYNLSLDELTSVDAGNRWVKRLKLSSSNSSVEGTKRSDFDSSLSHERKSKLFNGIPKSNIPRSKPNLRKHHDEGSLVSNLSKKDADHLIEDPKDKGKTLLLSHAWIQRWMHTGPRKMEKNSEMEVICEAESSKVHKEQFPSIAAMALMGKVLTCSEQCELQKKGSFTVWNTKTL
ncbi:hypothetical protein C2S51_038476 [Perilla frutescens var. frutescens]|nr:hypothetical protein C2S51_038476 [Perilla frutescens var. frutescens]